MEDATWVPTVVSAMLTQATGHAEREAAKPMNSDARAANPEGEIILGADKGYDAGEFIKALQDIEVRAPCRAEQGGQSVGLAR